jgi:hypothetical protein
MKAPGYIYWLWSSLIVLGVFLWAIGAVLFWAFSQ